jgi:hypothetical protein
LILLLQVIYKKINFKILLSVGLLITLYLYIFLYLTLIIFLYSLGKNSFTYIIIGYITSYPQPIYKNLIKIYKFREEFSEELNQNNHFVYLIVPYELRNAYTHTASVTPTLTYRNV